MLPWFCRACCSPHSPGPPTQNHWEDCSLAIYAHTNIQMYPHVFTNTVFFSGDMDTNINLQINIIYMYKPMHVHQYDQQQVFSTKCQNS